jgi:arabinose-5-phosphate isomerase
MGVLHLTNTQQHEADLNEARRLLQAEATALTTLAQKLGDSFTSTVDVLLHIKGRAIVTGMGKSGHIGAKIAATLASTGTPAFYIHPGEASHGDLGMITADDAVIALSHSGESKELSDIIAYCTRYSVPLIAITGRASSTLAQAASHVLLNEVETEACPLNLAPTSSTTTSLALGDALAIVLMQRRGFKKEDFSRYHPGGKLGAQLLKVRDIMLSQDLPVTKPDAPMTQVLVELTDKNMGCVGIVEDGNLVGIITDGDLKRHMAPDILSKTATDIMTPTPATIREEAFATSAVQQMQKKKITVLFVVRGQKSKKPVGLLHMHHCLQAGIV